MRTIIIITILSLAGCTVHGATVGDNSLDTIRGVEVPRVCHDPAVHVGYLTALERQAEIDAMPPGPARDRAQAVWLAQQPAAMQQWITAAALSCAGYDPLPDGTVIPSVLGAWTLARIGCVLAAETLAAVAFCPRS